MRQERLLPLLLCLCLGTSSFAKKVCKTMPGDASYPNARELKAFSDSLSVPLIQGQRPVGSVCYSSEVSFNSDSCAYAVANQHDDIFLSKIINGLHRLNSDGVLKNGTLQACPYPPTANDTCFQGRVPPLAVNVTKVSDIQKAVKFASSHNLRLVIKNTGHEGIGRPFGVGALEVFTQNLQDIKFTPSFKPSGAPKTCKGVPAMTLGAGVNWGQAYRAADANNQTIVGGLSPEGTVGAAGGWPLGGGHSSISPFYGLGVDNVLELTVVLPDARLVTVNSYTNSDLFWAIRGGGGPSFGIATSITYKTHPSVPYTAQYYGAVATTSAAFQSLMTTWMRNHNAISDAGWGGIWPFFSNSLFLSILTQGAPPTATAAAAMDKFINESLAIPGVIVLGAQKFSYSSFLGYFENNIKDISATVHLDYSTALPSAVQDATSSWLMHRNSTAPENAEAFGTLLASSPLLGLPFMVAGGQVAKGSVDSSAASPAWRTTITDLTFVANGAANVSTTALYQAAHQAITPFKELSPLPYGGQYLNEADILEEQWQQAYWGKHYPRLRSLKQKIDPNDLLIVQKGVNSEGWDAEIICKTV